MNVTFRDLKGLNIRSPAAYTSYGSRTSASVSAFKAVNVRKSPQGFISAFHTVVTEFQLRSTKPLKAFNLGGFIYILQDKEMYKYDPQTQYLELVFVFDKEITGTWTFAIFSSHVIVANSGVGHWVFKIVEGKRLEWDAPISMLKEDIWFVGSFKNRLIYVTQSGVGWSVLDMPKDVDVTQKKGAGIQSLTAVAGIVKPQGVAILNEKIMVFTTKGILELKSTRRAIPFTFDQVAGPEASLLNNRTLVDDISGIALYATATGIYKVDNTFSALDVDLNLWLEHTYFKQYAEDIELHLNDSTYEVYILIKPLRKFLVWNMLLKELTEVDTYGDGVIRVDYKSDNLLLGQEKGRLVVSSFNKNSFKANIERPVPVTSYKSGVYTYTARSSVYFGSDYKTVLHKHGYWVTHTTNAYKALTKRNTRNTISYTNLGSFQSDLRHGNNVFNLQLGTSVVNYEGTARSTNVHVRNTLVFNHSVKEAFKGAAWNIEVPHTSVVGYHLVQPTMYTDVRKSYKADTFHIITGEQHGKTQVIPYVTNSTPRVIVWDFNTRGEIRTSSIEDKSGCKVSGGSYGDIPTNLQSARYIHGSEGISYYKKGVKGNTLSIEITNPKYSPMDLRGVGLNFIKSGRKY